MKFWLGTHMPGWLATVDVPLFVSHRRLHGYRRLPRAVGCWALDSGGFTELNMRGAWRTSPVEYVAAVRRYRDEIGGLAWAAPQDWMCEPAVRAKTGLGVADHQRLTTENYLTLRALDASLPFIPVLQGWQPGDYLRHAEAYAAAGVDLAAESLVGLGSVCRRQNTAQIERIVESLQPLRLHGLGVKTAGLASYSDLLTSADSLAWSYRGRHEPGCTPTHRSEANCRRFALAWRDRVIGRGPGGRQLALTLDGAT